jgi:hypothetical protein
MENVQLLAGLTVLCLAAGLYAAAQTVRDVRRGHSGWAVAGGAATIALFGGALAVLLQPVQTHAVKIDLPVAGH